MEELEEQDSRYAELLRYRNDEAALDGAIVNAIKEMKVRDNETPPTLDAVYKYVKANFH